MSDEKVVCKECETVLEVRRLGNHVRDVHKLLFKEYHVKHVHGGKVPLCGCGCGEETLWKGGLSRFRKFRNGHHNSKQSEFRETRLCKACNTDVNAAKFTVHVRDVHKLLFKDYTLKFEHDNAVPLCKCGCGNETDWNGGKKAFNEFVPWHSLKTNTPDDDERRERAKFERLEKHETDDTDVNCRECGKTFRTSKLGRHLRAHKMLVEDYIVKHELGGVYPTCKCGCGQRVNWSGVLHRFLTHVEDHDDRIERNKKIAATVSKNYEGESGETLKKLISDKTREALTDPTIRIRMSDHAADKAIANPSKGEVTFVDELVKVFGEDDVIRGYKLYVDGIHKVYDAYVRSLRALIEYDGRYYHGLNMKAGDVFKNHMICFNAANDFYKTRSAVEKKLSLFRVAEGTSLDKLSASEQSLLDHSYFAVMRGILTKGVLRDESDDILAKSSELWHEHSEFEREELVSSFKRERRLLAEVLQCQ